MKFIDFPKQYFVGLKKNPDNEKDLLRLGFATPMGTDATFEKRKATVVQWAKGRYYWRNDHKDESEYVTFDNVPVDGFSIETSVSRSYTSNKLFQINDPRGFRLEISTDNLCDILLNSVVDHGVIKKKLIWGRDGNINRLYFEDDSQYLESLQEKETYEVQVGDEIESERFHGIYLGKYYVQRITDWYEKTNIHGWYGPVQQHCYGIVYDTKPYLIIDEKAISGYEWSRETLIRNLPKKFKVVTKSKIKDAKPPLNVLTENGIVFHETLEELKAFSLTKEEIDICMKRWYNRPHDNFEERMKSYVFVEEKTLDPKKI